jgi:hypothetical protein
LRVELKYCRRNILYRIGIRNKRLSIKIKCASYFSNLYILLETALLLSAKVSMEFITAKCIQACTGCSWKCLAGIAEITCSGNIISIWTILKGIHFLIHPIWDGPIDVIWNKNLSNGSVVKKLLLQ